MGKLKLSVEDLQVESFATADAAARPGTVHGHLESAAETCNPADYTCNETCPPKLTCNRTECAGYTCESTCPPKFTCEWPCVPTNGATCGPTEYMCC